MIITELLITMPHFFSLKRSFPICIAFALHISNKDFHFSRGLSRLSNLFNLISCAVLCNIHCCLIHLGSNCIYQAYFNEFPCSRLLQLENYYKVIYNELIESFNGASEVAYSIFTKRILLKIL